MIVCEYCMQALESHGERQMKRIVDPENICNEDKIVECEFCDDEFTVNDCPTMYEI